MGAKKSKVVNDPVVVQTNVPGVDLSVMDNQQLLALERQISEALETYRLEEQKKEEEEREAKEAKEQQMIHNYLNSPAVAALRKELKAFNGEMKSLDGKKLSVELNIPVKFTASLFSNFDVSTLLDPDELYGEYDWNDLFYNENLEATVQRGDLTAVQKTTIQDGINDVVDGFCEDVLLLFPEADAVRALAKKIKTFKSKVESVIKKAPAEIGIYDLLDE